MNGRDWIRLVPLLLAAVLLGCGKGPIEVRTSRAVFGNLITSYVADALVRATTATISSRDIAVVEKILVKEGDSIRRGQLLVQLQTADLNAAVRESEEAAQVARGGLLQAEEAVRSARIAQVSRMAVAQSAVREAEARLRQAQQQTRTSEIRAAEHRVASLRAAMVEADRTLARMKVLHEEGAVSRAALDQSEARAASARQQYEAARDDLQNLMSGPTPTDSAAAAAAVESSRIQLAAARASRSEIDVLEMSVQQAKARVRQALAGIERARALLSDRSLNAPFSGKVLRIDAEPGETASPGKTLLVVVDPNSAFVEAEVGDEDAAKVQTGQLVSVSSASYPGRRIPGKVRRISPAAERKEGALTDRRILRFEIELLKSKGLFTPGEEVDVYADAVSRVPALLVPSDSIVTSGGRSHVWRVVDGKVRQVEVRLGTASFDQTEVFGGLSQDDQVVVTGKEDLAEGVSVKVVAK